MFNSSKNCKSLDEMGNVIERKKCRQVKSNIVSIRNRQTIVMVNAINFAGNEPPEMQTESKNVYTSGWHVAMSHSGGTGTPIL